MAEELKEKYAEVAKLKTVYSSGQGIFLSHDGNHVICGVEEDECMKINIIHKDDESVKKLDLADEIVSFVVSQHDSTLIVATKSLFLQLWNWQTGKMIRHWKAGHSQRVSCMALSVCGTRLLTGSSDRHLRLWRLTADSEAEEVTVELSRIWAAGADMPILVRFHPRRDLVVSVTRAEAALRVWGFGESREVARLSGHAGEVTAVEFWRSEDAQDWMISCCQGKLVIVWDLARMEKVSTIPTLERLTACLVVSSGYFNDKVRDVPLILTGGVTGILRLWRADKASCLMEIRRAGLNLASVDDEMKEYSLSSVVRIVPGPGDHFLVVRASASIEFYRQEKAKVDFEWISDVGDVRKLALCGRRHDCLVALTSGSSQLLLFPHLPSSPRPCWRGLTTETGHSQPLTDLAVSPDGLRVLTASKDRCVRLWAVEEGEEVTGLRLVCVGAEHAGHVTAVAFHGQEGELGFSAAQEGELRMWRLSAKKKEMKVLATVAMTHRMMVNCICADEKGKFLATASKDKTIKIWTVGNKSVKEHASLVGHTRGIWSVRFSPFNQRLLTAAGDGTKLWSLEDFQCIATFENDGGPAYQAIFVAGGQQFVGSDQSGRVTLTTVKGQHVVQRSAVHEGRVWALCVDATGERLVSGSETGELVLWKDVSEEERAAKQQEIIKTYQIEDEVNKLLQIGKLHRALKFVIKADQPVKAYKIIRDIRLSDNPVVLNSALDEVMRDEEDLRRLLGYCVAWNSHNQRFLEAKAVVAHVLTSFRPERLAEIGRGDGGKPAFDFARLVPHFQRHQRRESRFSRAAMLAPYLQALAAGVAESKPMEI